MSEKENCVVEVMKKLTRWIVTSVRRRNVASAVIRAPRNDISLDWRVPEAIRVRDDTSSTCACIRIYGVRGVIGI